MLSKTNCSPGPRFKVPVIIALFLTVPLYGAQGELPPKLLGATSCSSSSCHGGGGADQNQYLVWSLRDFHSQRPVATLATARSKQIADTLEIKDPTTESRCTTCHAPLQSVPQSLRGENFNASEGVSCESCHGPAESWLRSHTRPDYTHAARVAAGMRDLQNLYVRANTCVACHQNVDSDILAAGHPELIFELDGQSVSEPKHWREATNWNGAQAWLVGQAVALREMSWQLSREKSPSQNQINRWTGLFRVLTTATAADRGWPVMPSGGYVPVQNWSDAFARTIAAIEWTPTLTKKCLAQLAASDSNTVDVPTLKEVRTCEADRLVLGLDRLVGALPELKENQPVQATLNQLFTDAQVRPDFNPAKFAGDLDRFSRALNGK